MPTQKEWKAYIERLKLQIKAVHESKLDKETKERVIDELLDKLSIVLRYFLEE